MRTSTLRKALNADAQKVAEVYIRSRRAAMPLIPPYMHTDDEVRAWISSIVIPMQDTWVAEMEDRRIVAMMSLENGWIDQLYVDPAWNGLTEEITRNGRPPFVINGLCCKRY